MKMNVPSKTALMIFIVLFSAALALAQAGRGIARLGGVVVDIKGKPIPSAKVVLVFAQDENVKQETTSNTKGEWAFMGIGTGNWVVTASAPGYVPASETRYVSQLAQKNPRVTLKLQKAEKGTAPAVQDETSFALLDEANQYYKDGKYDAAMALFQQFLDNNPVAYQVVLNIGDCYREKEDYENAIKNYNNVIEQAKGDTTMGKDITAKALAAIGLCYLRQSNLEEAQKYFEQSLDTAPQDENLAYNVGEIYFSNQKIDEALTYFELAAKIKPDWPDPYLKLGYVYLNKGDMGKAVEYLDKFLKLEPNTERSAQVQNIINTIKK
jgi:tetratricopeptide (TPR) repeat protein